MKKLSAKMKYCSCLFCTYHDNYIYFSVFHNEYKLFLMFFYTSKSTSCSLCIIMCQIQDCKHLLSKCYLSVYYLLMWYKYFYKYTVLLNAFSTIIYFLLDLLLFYKFETNLLIINLVILYNMYCLSTTLKGKGFYLDLGSPSAP